MQLQVEDEGAGGVLIDCVIGVSTESIVLLELATRQPVLVFPTDLLLGEYSVTKSAHLSNCVIY